jgi:mono/diheme cytochrome c family protein
MVHLKERLRMIRRGVMVAGATFAILLAAAIGSKSVSAQDKKPAGQTPAGWSLPPDAADTKSPLTVDEKVIATGRAIFKDKCQRCHGPGGLGDGEDADPDARDDMDLTNPKRADRNVDGVVYYKVANGRRRPKMPAFKDELKPEQIWAVVAYAQTLRKKP